MSTCCLICYRVDNYFGDSDSEDDDKTGKSSSWLSSLNRFFLLLERHLSDHSGVGNGGAGVGLTSKSKPRPKSRKRSQLRKVNVGQLIKGGLRPCEDCTKQAESFCSLYQEMKRLELLLQWKVWTLKNIMFCAQRVPVRVGALREFVAKMEGQSTDGGLKIEQVFQSILNFKKGLVKKCSKRLLNSFPRLTLSRRGTSAIKNSSLLTGSRSDSDTSSGKRKIKDAFSKQAKRTNPVKSTPVKSPKKSGGSADSTAKFEVDKQSQKKGDTERSHYKIKIVEFDSESEFEVSVCNYGEKGKEDDDYLSDGNNHSSSDSDSDSAKKSRTVQSDSDRASDSNDEISKPPNRRPEIFLFGHSSNSRTRESFEEVAFQKEGNFTRVVRQPKGQKPAIPPTFPNRPLPAKRFVFPASCMPIRILEPNRPAFSNGYGSSSSPTPVYADFDAFLSDLLNEDGSASNSTPTSTATEPQKLHTCPECKMDFMRSHNLHNHRLKVHGAAATVIDLMYRCGVDGCTSQFGTRVEFETHRHLHHVKNNDTSSANSNDSSKLKKDNDSSRNTNLEVAIPKRYGRLNKSWEQQLKEMASGNAARKVAVDDVICLSDSE